LIVIWLAVKSNQIKSNQIKIYIAPYVHEDSEALETHDHLTP